MWSGEVFGSSEEDDQDVLLALLCKHLADGRSGMYHIQSIVLFETHDIDYLQ